MKTIILKNSKLKGEVSPPASKSILHRYIIAASFAKGISKISDISLSEDILATINAMKQLGAEIEINNRELLIDGSSLFSIVKNNKIIIDCNESGSTLRFMIPISIIKNNEVIFCGKDSLFKRPLEPYFEIFEKDKIEYNFSPDLEEKLYVNGELKSREYEVVGNISSQFITGLLFALPLLKENSTIKVIGELESKSYIDLTLNCLAKFGIKFENRNYEEIKIYGSQEYKTVNMSMEADFSQIAFFYVANYLGANINIKNINLNSLQGDKVIMSLIEKLKKNEDDEIVINGGNCPDVIPVFSLAAAYSNKKIKIENVARLRIKESDRLSITVQELSKLGFDLQEQGDSIIINYRNKTQIKKEKVYLSSHNDHRIAMMIAIASTFYRGEIVLDDADCVKKSYPNFWEVFSSIGGKFNEYMGK